MSAPLLLREIERIARERGWSHSRLARELGVDPSTLSHVRSGRDPLSQALLVQIGVVFGASSPIRNLLLHYLLVEAPQRYAVRRTGATPAVFADVPYKVRWRIRRWLAQLGDTDQPQRGLFLAGENASLLSAAARFAVHEAEAQQRSAVMVRGNAHLAASHAAAALQATVLVIERIDFASPGVAQLVHARTDALKPLVVTSARPRDHLADPHLARALRAWTEGITVLAAPPTSSRPRHAHAV